MAYMLDTNIVSDLVRNPQGRVQAKIKAVGENQIFISVMVAAELHYGLARKKSRRLTDQLETVLRGVEILPLAEPVDRVYGELRAQLETAGRPIGLNALLIVAHAMALGHTLVTANMREFSRIRGLKVENWLS
jgi:tRNA(fMet)-specific endonuclease VapC